MIVIVDYLISIKIKNKVIVFFDGNSHLDYLV